MLYSCRCLHGEMNVWLDTFALALSNFRGNRRLSSMLFVVIIRKLKFTLSRVALNQIYFSFVLPILECSSIVWDDCSQQDSIALARLHNEAARIVTGLIRSVTIDNLNRECGWSFLAHRRNQHKRAFLYSFGTAVLNKIPSHLTDCITKLPLE